MTLRERLDAAREERRRAAGLPPTPPAEPATMTTDDVVAKGDFGVDLDSVVDLRTPAPVIDLRPLPPERPESTPPPSNPSFTAALAVSTRTTCPQCGGPGQRDMQDVVGGVDHYSCTFCGHLWQVAR